VALGDNDDMSDFKDRSEEAVFERFLERQSSAQMELLDQLWASIGEFEKVSGLKVSSIHFDSRRDSMVVHSRPRGSS